MFRSQVDGTCGFRLQAEDVQEIMKARVFVTLKPSVFDPQGQTIADALHSMGYAGVGDVRQGKYFELELATASADQAKALASEVADKLLANPVIESYRVEIV
jgi:phosphoribosylformylglycinamidine synthase subunit PurS